MMGAIATLAALFCVVSPTSAALLWPTAGGDGGRTHSSLHQPTSGPLAVKSSTPWDPCQGASGGFCEYDPDLLSDGTLVLHWSSAHGLAARAIANLSSPLWTYDLGDGLRGCAAFDTATAGRLATQALDKSGVLTVAASTLDASNPRAPPKTTHAWTVDLGATRPAAGSGVTCFAQLDGADSASLVFATQTADDGLLLRFLAGANKTQSLVAPSLAVGNRTIDGTAAACLLADLDPIVIDNGTKVGLTFSCTGGFGDTLAVYAVPSDLDRRQSTPAAPPLWTATTGPNRMDFACTRTRAADGAVMYDTNAAVPGTPHGGMYGMLASGSGKPLWSEKIADGAPVGGFLAAGPSSGLLYRYEGDAAPHKIVAVGHASGAALWTYMFSPAASVEMVLGQWLPDGGAIVVYYTTSGENTVVRVDSSGKAGKPVMVGTAILPPVVNNLLVLPDGDILLWLGGNPTIVRLG